MDNMDLWNRVSKTDPRHVKPITGKQYSGNSPKPYYIVQKLTEEFGPCGKGWGFTIVSERMERLTETDVLHIAHVRLWWLDADQVRCEFDQMGQTKACYQTAGKQDRDGNTLPGKMLVDEDAPKKSVTDALVKCASYLGFAGDIFSGRWDDSKYVADLKREFTDKPATDSEAVIAQAKARPPSRGVANDLLDQHPEAIEAKRMEYLSSLADDLIEEAEGGRTFESLLEAIEKEKLEDLEKIFLWTKLPSKVRTGIKAAQTEAAKLEAARRHEAIARS